MEGQVPSVSEQVEQANLDIVAPFIALYAYSSIFSHTCSKSSCATIYASNSRYGTQSLHGMDREEGSPEFMIVCPPSSRRVTCHATPVVRCS